MASWSGPPFGPPLKPCGDRSTLHAPVPSVVALAVATSDVVPLPVARLSVTATLTPATFSPMFPLTCGEYAVTVTLGSGTTIPVGALVALAVDDVPPL